MGATEWGVLLLGVAAIAGLNWYFFVAPARGGVTVADDEGSGKVVIAVKGGYDPSLIRVKAGRPLQLVFDRQENNSCSEEIVIPDFGIRTFLPAFKQTTIELTPKAPGRYPFTCGMSMLHGTIVAE